MKLVQPHRKPLSRPGYVSSCTLDTLKLVSVLQRPIPPHIGQSVHHTALIVLSLQHRLEGRI